MIWEARGGGSFAVLPKESVGKVSANFPLVAGHSAEVLEIEFNPFNDNLIVSASEDGYAKVWNIPDGGLKEEMKEPVQNLVGHKRKVGTVNHNPVSNNVLATTSTDFSVKIWDIEKGDSRLDVPGHVDIIQSVAWNFDGSHLATASKDKKVRILDPRSGSIVQEVEAHGGVKGMRVLYLGSKEYLLTVGFSKTSDRQYGVWDPRKLVNSLAAQNIDTASGMIMPFYDEDTSVLFLAGKGDGNIRYYEVVTEEPYLRYLTEFKSASPQRGMGFMPKLSLDFGQCEIARALKVTGNAIEPVSFCVPRKSDIFQDDLYPDTYAGEPALSSDQWFNGQTAKPKLVKVEPGDSFKSKPQTEFKPVVKDEPKPLSEVELRKEYERLYNRVAYLEAELLKRDARIKELESK